MRQQYGDEVAESLFKGLSQEPSVSIRLNPKKRTPQPPLGGDGMMQPNYALCTMKAEGLGKANYELEKLSWCPDAFYLPERPAFTFDPLFHAGVYYVQEASSMYLAEVLRKYIQPPQPPRGSKIAGAAELSSPCIQPAYSPSGAGGAVAGKPLVALDLCAAPGGKSTLLRSLLPEDWLLVSNEPMPKRAQVLAENMIKWGHANSIVTQNYPADFAPLVHQFDLIVTDVPCSGEGMFRKDEGAIRDWSLENVDICWRRQRDILTDIWPTLKPGGLLVYSTCTFNHFEDEDNVAWIASHLGAEILEQRHFLPGRDPGEGFFIAALRKAGKEDLQGTPADPKKLTNKIRHALRVLHDGIPAPTTKGKDIIPSHTLAMSADHLNDTTYPSCELTYQEALAYLRHEVLRIEAPRGIVRVTFKGIPLGFVKNIGNRANNLYPQEWRIRTSYTTPFCLFDN